MKKRERAGLLTCPNLVKKWVARELPAGDLDLMWWMEGASGTISIRAVRLLVTSTSYGRSTSGSCASCETAHHVCNMLS